MEVKNKRLRLLTENDREVKLSLSRISHKSSTYIDLSLSRYNLVESLKKTSNKRKDLVGSVNIRELWDVLHAEQEWVDMATMTCLCFPDNPDGDHEAAVVRAIFNDRLYFKFDHNRFFPNSEKRVEQIAAHRREEARRNRIIEEGGAWLKLVNRDKGYFSPDSLSLEYIEILKSFYLFEKESPYYALGKAILEKAGIRAGEAVFPLLVKLGVWDKNENIELHRYKIPISFPAEVMKKAAELAGSELARRESGGVRACPPSVWRGRVDLTMLPVITIDGQSTTDFDDALSIEEMGDHYRLGIHISDVGHYIKKRNIIDEEALVRGSSIYTLDRKIPMLPACFAEDLCSLKAGELRPAISVMVKLSRFFEPQKRAHSPQLAAGLASESENSKLPYGRRFPATCCGELQIIDFEIIPSLIRVKQQLTYYDVNMIAEDNRKIGILYDIAKKFREFRLGRGAVQITLPEINIRTNEAGELTISRIQRESPGRMLVAEIMIMANWLMARFLAKHDAPAIFRSQPEPRARLYKGNEGTLFQNWMQRKLLSRYVLSMEPEHHSGLGLEAYVTATSPIRKYYDFATQRQIRAILGLEEPYSIEDIQRIIQLLEQPMNCVLKIQNSRHRYWLLKYLETRINQKEEAVVLFKRKDSYLALMKEYMIECELPVSSGIDLKPEDLIQVRIQHVNARKDVLSVYMG
ncbi:MAG: RNB domain-containing ribonuclease [Desulfobacteraceae bacterium]|uniref:RNB domain-containing ribonuclease n=1 Tax=Candidatus Desulfaltia bathyphila TaxID=2841697 RepID=A0A8J6N235_9BACT|nr:RNB domain-containing ribonuclease [Candidatus Desulfaltia bathyphila]MBL7194939.1 RNB domain-containing ribonuclease [Desulfobacterales bacterium]